MAASCPKQYLPVAGQSILQRSASAFLQHPAIAHVFVIVSPGDACVTRELRPDQRMSVLYCGGATRSESVMHGLRAMQERVHPQDWVMVHDAARPGINGLLLDRLIDSVGEDEVGGLLALPVADTVKLQTSAARKNNLTTIPRSGLWLAQTPQMFRHGQLLAALQHATENGIDITDEASAMEASGHVPILVEGHWCNTKITRPDDFTLVETYLTTLAQS